MLKKGRILKKKKEIELVLKKGKSIYNEVFSFKFLPNKLEPPGSSKVAFLCSKKVFPKAVQRNKAKRRMRHILKDFFPEISLGAWLVFFFKKEFLEMPFKELKEQTKNALKRGGLLKGK
ncbi:MAG: ribonuclease P protein component [bacterium]|nr:ribonuclease P protein component [bacterium]